MNDHNLDDLIIDTIEPSHSKTKSFLTIIALLIVFLIVGIILAKMYTEDSSSAILKTKDNNSVLIAPELKLQAPKKVPKVEKELSLSTIIEEEIKAPKKEPIQKEVTKEPAPPKEPLEGKIAEIKKETVIITEEFTQKPPAEKLPIEEIPEASTPKPLTKEIKKSTPVAMKKETSKTLPHVSYFIQVGSFSQAPSTRFLSVIKNSGFHYSITKANTKGIKKLLIGPYRSRASVDAALIQVRDRINKKAFVVKK